MRDSIDLDVLFDELNDLHFNGEIPKVPVTWNNRLRTTAGRCFSAPVANGREPTRIDLANRLFANNDWDVDKVKRTLVHEMVHAYLIHKYNELGHTDRFHWEMSRITGEWINHRCHDYNTDGLRQKRNIEVCCPAHGVVGLRARMPKKNTRYTHRGCGQFVTFKRVRTSEEKLSVGISLD